MDVPSLILLGAAGGLLRGALDLYTRFVSWQTDRRTHRQSAAAGTALGEVPRFQTYFDPAVDTVAAVVHSLMGAGAAVLFGTTGQISGAYAALVVGMSAPMLLTQLGRIQTVNEAVTGTQQPAADTGVTSAAGAATDQTAAAAGAVTDQTATAAVAPSPTLPPPQPPPAQPSPASADPALPLPQPSPAPADPAPAPRQPSPAPGEYPSPVARPTSAPRQPAVVADADAEARTDGTGPGLDGRGAPRWRQGPAVGEEGL